MNFQFSIGLLADRGLNKAVDFSVRNSAALQLLGVSVRSQTISMTPVTKNSFTDFDKALGTVRDEWEYAQKHARHGNVIDGSALEPLLGAIQANRESFPPGEFTIKVQWPDGASIETTVPPMAGISVRSVSISAVFARVSTAQQASVAPTSQQTSYQEWQ
ncbi:hypothetical protein [Mesorhizobium sp. 113-3-9]|uniref:hypothetical protein n=1 Tax=Mesorhizobium sp. 113-3-9 TaxID=2744517 RepID=UPI001927664A|nr:hypothetical protein [Mesorhizobium sp. 113-3-9]